MKYLKGFLVTILGLFIMVTLISLFIPSRIVVAKAVVIHAPADKIYDQVTDLSKWRNWHPVFKAIPAQIKLSDPPFGRSAWAEWALNDHTNKIQVTSTGSNGIKFLLQRKGEMNMDNMITIRPVEDSSALQVQWQTITHLRWYPWEKFSGIFIEGMSGPGYQEALESLKTYMEN